MVRTRDMSLAELRMAESSSVIFGRSWVLIALIIADMIAIGWLLGGKALKCRSMLRCSAELRANSSEKALRSAGVGSRPVMSSMAVSTNDTLFSAKVSIGMPR